MATSAQLSTAQGSLRSCGPNATPAFQMNCSGPSCAAIKTLFGSQCTGGGTSGDPLVCNNGVTNCPPSGSSSGTTSALLSSSFNFTQTSSALQQSNPQPITLQTQTFAVNGCPVAQMSSSGTADSVVVNLLQQQPQTRLVQAAQCNAASGGGGGAAAATGGTQTSGSGNGSGSGGSGTGSSTGSAPGSSFTGSSSCQLPSKFALFASLLLGFAFFVQGAAATAVDTSQLDKRQSGDAYTQFSANYKSQLTAQLGGAGTSVTNSLVDGIGYSVCGANLPQDQTLGTFQQLVTNCIKAVYSGGISIPDFSGQFLAVVGGSLLCNLAVSDAFTDLGGIAGISQQLVCGTLAGSASIVPPPTSTPGGSAPTSTAGATTSPGSGSVTTPPGNSGGTTPTGGSSSPFSPTGSTTPSNSTASSTTTGSTSSSSSSTSTTSVTSSSSSSSTTSTATTSSSTIVD